MEFNDLSEDEILNMYNNILEGPETLMLAKYNCMYDCRYFPKYGTKECAC